MNIRELVIRLEKLQKSGDQESTHLEADRLLLEYINEQEVIDAYEGIDKWYA